MTYFSEDRPEDIISTTPQAMVYKDIMRTVDRFYGWAINKKTVATIECAVKDTLRGHIQKGTIPTNKWDLNGVKAAVVPGQIYTINIKFPRWLRKWFENEN